MRKIALLLMLPAALAAQNFDTIQIKSQALRGGVYMLTGSGGNIGLSIGDEMAFVIDDQYAPLSAKILAHIATLTNKPVKFVLNTHWHGDHSGGNENMGKAGALLVAHENARRRMSTGQFIEFLKRTEPPAAPGALPVVTFTDSIAFHVNGDDIVAFHVSPAHTDGDVIVHFTKANVVHMGDVLVLNGFPFIDLSSGGNANGVVDASDRVLSFCNAETKIIPGHGPAAVDCATLRAYRDMVFTVRERVRAAMRQGKTLAEIKALKPTQEFDATHKGSRTPDDFVDFVYRSLGGK